MKRHHTIFWVIALTFVATFAMGTAIANAQDHSVDFLPSPEEFFTDVTLINQDGVEKRLYTDLLKDRLVVVSVFNSDCEGDCPSIMKRLVEVQKRLITQSGQNVNFLSFSMDPELDRPAKLKKYADGLNVAKGWDFLTGDVNALQSSLDKFGQGTHDSTILLIGNAATGTWKMASGLSTPEVIQATISDMLGDTGSRLTLNMDD